MLSRKSQRAALLGTLIIGALVTGCLNRPLAPVDPSTQSGVFVEIRQTGTTKVDMLFVVDNSNSMHEEQAVLADQIVTMARELINPSVNPETGEAPPAVEDLHIGIVTTDMGTGGYTIMTCADPMQGDNGVLQDMGRLDGCQPTYTATDCTRASCPWLTHSGDAPDDGSDPANPPIWDDFGCVATLGTGGCGFEQQLEASLVAVTMQAEPGRPNEGFIRDDSLVAIVYVTDEDDCSAEATEIFNPSRTDIGPLNVRCAMRDDMLHPVDRYYNAFVGLRPGNQDLVVVAAITGVPIDGSWSPGDRIEDLIALRRQDPDNPNELMPSCETGMGYAYPPVRLTELVYMFGNNGILESICRSDWRQALEAITRKIQSKLTGACMARELASTDPGVCRVIETLINDAPCPSLAEGMGADRTGGWHLDLGVDEDGRRQCEILPADYDGDSCPDGSCDCAGGHFNGCLSGWFYAHNDAQCPHGQVRFTSSEITSDLSDVRFECLSALCPQRRQCVGAAAFADDCDASNPDSCGGGRTCIRHNSTAVCGDQGTCGRCSQTVGQVCSSQLDSNPYMAERPLVEGGGCCQEGFHCEGEMQGAECRPNRTFECD